MRRRRTRSRLTGCPFSIIEISQNGAWILFVRAERHNHKASTHRSAHLVHRRLGPAQRTEATELSRAGIPSRSIAGVLQATGTGFNVLVKDIYNAKQHLRTETLAGRTPIQALLGQLDQQNIHTKTQMDADIHLIHFFFAFREAVTVYIAYPEVFLLDCTYKTNHFNMPLLNIISITGLDTTFYLAYVFFLAEAEGDFVRALQHLKNVLSVRPSIMVTDRDLALMNAISTIFPSATHFLCQWHVQKNVLAKCRPFFTTHTALDSTLSRNWTEFMQAWTGAINAPMSEKF